MSGTASCTSGTVNTQAEANKIWDAIKTIPDWPTDIVADIKATGPQTPRARPHTVKSGDTLSKIAKEPWATRMHADLRRQQGSIERPRQDQAGSSIEDSSAREAESDSV